MRRGVFWTACFTLGLAACGGAAAEEECELFARTICERAEECLEPGSDVDACAEQSATILNCDRAESVAAGFDTCIETVRTDSCDELFPDGPQSMTPAVCRGVIQIEL
jgi:hypothetical protein